MIYLWEIPDNYPENLIGRYRRETSPDRFLFKKGEVLPDTIGNLEIEFDVCVKDLQMRDDLANSSMIPVVSSRLANALCELAPDDIQLFDVSISASDGNLEGYKLLNIVHKVDALDREQSEYSLIPGTDKILSFSKLTFKENGLLGHHLARDSSYNSHLLISDWLANKLNSLKFEGIGLYAPEKVL